jgi:hypothetical protein
MITQNHRVLLPTYGRDYNSAKLAKEAFLGGKDWLYSNFDGQGYCSISDFSPNLTVNLRYKKQTMVTQCKVPAKEATQ